MKKILLFTFLLSFFNSFSQISCDATKTKIILIGDSWANYTNTSNAIPNNLDRYGFTNIGMYSSAALSVNGLITDDLLNPTFLSNLQSEINSHTDVEIITISIGGNDILNNWNKNMDSTQTDSLLNVVFVKIDSIIKLIKAFKPNLYIHLPGYDYGNFDEVINTFAIPTSHPFYNKWNGMGKPTFLELNTVMMKASKKFKKLGKKYQITFSDASGLMQYVYGQPTALGVPPGGTYAKRTVPLPGGRLNYPSPKAAMKVYFGTITDCFHLSDEGYDHFYSYHFKKYYWKYLRQSINKTFYSEGGSKDGGVSSLATVASGNVTVGNSLGTGIYKGIVSFNTASIPSSKTIYNSDLYLFRDKLTGSLPTFDKVILEIKQGNFGSSVSVDNADYTSVSDKKDTACVYGTVAENGYWLRIKLPKTFHSKINKSGVTQFRIGMLDTTSGSILYYSTGDSTNKPMLDIEYYNPASVSEKTDIAGISLFPNPTNSNFVKINGLKNNLYEISVIDISGRIVIPVFRNAKTMDVSKLSKGTYFVIFKGKDSFFSKKLIKQ